MKKIMLLLMIIFTFALFGCAQTDVQETTEEPVATVQCPDGSFVENFDECPEPEVEEPEVEEEKEEVVEEPKVQKDPELSSSVENEIENRLRTKLFQVYPGQTAQLDVGEKGVVGVGIRNSVQRERRFMIEVTPSGIITKDQFHRKMDSSAISWIKTDLDEVYVVAGRDSIIFPLVVEVKSTYNLAGDSTDPGKYTFKVDILELDDKDSAETVGTGEFTVPVNWD